MTYVTAILEGIRKYATSLHKIVLSVLRVVRMYFALTGKKFAFA